MNEFEQTMGNLKLMAYGRAATTYLRGLKSLGEFQAQCAKIDEVYRTCLEANRKIEEARKTMEKEAGVS